MMMMESVKSETNAKVVKMGFTVTKMMRHATSYTKHCFASSTQLNSDPIPIFQKKL
jgi:hypothetical protein